MVGGSGATIRVEENIASRIMCTLTVGTIVTVAEVRGRRCRLSDPVQGWGSLETETGYVIIEPMGEQQPSYRVSNPDGVVARSDVDPAKGAFVRAIPYGQIVRGSGQSRAVGSGEKRVQLEDGSWVTLEGSGTVFLDELPAEISQSNVGTIGTL